MKTITIGWLNKCRCGNKSHTVKTARGNETALWDDDAVKCNSCGRGGVIQVCEGQARVLWETDEEMSENKPMSTIAREPVTHNLKIWPEYFSAVRDGLKRAELRWNDREYQAGDILDLCEWDPNEEAFTGDFISVTVTHVAELGQWMPGYVLLSVAPPTPVSDEDLLHMAASAIDDLLSNKDRSGAGVWVDIPAKLRRSAMLQGADCNSPVMNDYPETLPCPVSLEPGLKFGKGVATKILLEALQRRSNYSDEIEVINEVCSDIKDGDFLAAAKINSSSELVNTAYKLPKPIKDHRLNSGPDADDYYAGYQAGWNDSIGEAVICNSPVIPDGWVMVPVEPTDDMIVNGFESEPDESFSDEKEWEAYDAMSGCQQAAHRAKLCWAAMIKAAPKLE